MSTSEYAAPALPVLSRARLKRLAIAGAAALALVTAGAWGYDWWTAGRFIESTDDAYVGGNVTSIAPHVSGFVAAIYVADNQKVRRGQLLMKLDDRDFRAAVDRAAAVLGEKKAALANLQASIPLQKALVDEALSNLHAKQAQARFAHDDDVRYQGLMRVVATSRQDVQRAATADREAGDAASAATAAVDAAKQQLAVLNTQINAAAASVAQAEAELRSARLNLGYTEIRAPIDGYIGNRAVRTGAYVTAGSYLVSVIPAHGLWVDANFKEDQLARIRPGEEATVSADVLPGHPFHGRVMSVAPGTGAVFSVIPPENATGNFTKIVQRVPVRIVLDSHDATLGTLRPGLSITASVDTKAAP